jgi:long-chain fatty acid transport protein
MRVGRHHTTEEDTGMRSARILVLLVGAALVLPTLSFGSGFALFEHGARGVALGGAFGATADNPTALYYNPAGIAFLEGTQAAAGAYFITFGAEFEGDNPYPGAGYKSEMESQIFYPAHAYVTGVINDRFHWGVGVTAPFGLGTWWPDDWAGKFITKRADLKVFNFNPNLSYKFSDALAVAVGFDYFLVDIDLTSSIAAINPYTQQAAEVGQAHMYADRQDGWGWNVALLAKLDGGFSAGLTYRSKVKAEMEGKGSFVQFPTGYDDFDAIVAGLIPFDLNPDAVTSVEFPDEARIALAWRNDRFTVEGDVVWMGWSSFQELRVTFPDYPQLSSVRPEYYEDSITYRLGVEYRKSETWSWLFGALYDETPVPTASVSPLLPDAERTGISLGFSWALSPSMTLDAGFLHLMFPDRSSEGLDYDNFNGTYKTSAELLGFSVVYKF